ncbi:MAG TPA: bifunctional [glutamate--ammonia ligase]-adenylyl-L-tyrosine phosphorylase/[glutamate--ammonia-ligase] adenylyltransferase, partial [Gemmataceae bacterium]
MFPDSPASPPDTFDAARSLLQGWRLTDFERGYRNLCGLREHAGARRVAELLPALSRLLPRTADPDMALNNLERLFARPGVAEQVPAFLEHRARGLETLLHLLGTSQFFADTLVTNPDFLDALRQPLRRTPGTQELLGQLQGEVDAAYEDSAVLRAFRRFRQRQLLRIGANDVIRDRPLEEITRELSRAADVALEVAFRTARRGLVERFGEPHAADGRPARCAVLAFGKLGGEELNYSSDIDLMFVYDADGSTRGRRTSLGNDEFFARLVGEVVRLLSAHTDRGQAYRVDLRLRPEGQRGPLARSLPGTLAYYDHFGRTWERQALIKLRPVAGDRALGQELIDALEPFVYRRYLTAAEINEIKAMKRRMERKARDAGESERDVKTGRGGIRDIEFAVQFLQLLNGGDLTAVRQRSTLAALEALASAGCLTHQEYRTLDDSY